VLIFEHYRSLVTPEVAEKSDSGGKNAIEFAA